MGVKEIGIKRTEDGGVFCEACGNDLKNGGSARLVAHMDGAKFYRNVWECAKCGAAITQEIERDPKSAAWWE